MVSVVNRRSVMTLFSGATDAYSHQVRYVMAEKGITADIVLIDPGSPNEELADYNPYGGVPTLVDRDLALYHAPIINDYLDERFPHPPLMPGDPVSRARARLALYRIERDLYRRMDLVLKSPKQGQVARRELTDDLIAISPLFEDHAFFMGDELTMADCVVAPLLWRLPQLKIDLPRQARSLLEYGNRLFQRGSFRLSLTVAEQELRG